MMYLLEDYNVDNVMHGSCPLYLIDNIVLITQHPHIYIKHHCSGILFFLIYIIKIRIFQIPMQPLPPPY